MDTAKPIPPAYGAAASAPPPQQGAAYPPPQPGGGNYGAPPPAYGATYPPPQPAGGNYGVPPPQPAGGNYGVPPATYNAPPPPQPQGFPQQQQQTVIIQQPTQAVANVRVGPSPITTTCTACQQHVVSSISYEAGSLTWIAAAVICFVGCDLGCCLIPFCVSGCKDVVHRCPHCGNHMGRYKRI